jgi:2-oxoacid:acceptor oxidoreductase delta subunit (pyruvate/2-ketoisovalerate family)
MIIANTKNEQNILALDVKPGLLATCDGVNIALEETGTAITNTCMLGAFARATNLVPLEGLKQALALYLTGSTLEKNCRSLARGFNEVRITRLSPSTTATLPTGTDTQFSGIKPPPSTSPFEAAWTDFTKKFLIEKTGEWRYRRPELKKWACRQCGWCSIYCPVGCMELDENSYYQPNLNYCKGCGVCAKECPAYAISMRPEEVM